MYEDNDIFEMFLEMMEQVDPEDLDGQVYIINKDTHYAAELSAAQKHNYTER